MSNQSTHQSKGFVVISAYQPKPGKEAALLELLQDHVPTLRMLGLASGFPRSLMTAANGAVVEIFEWDSEDASRRAHDHPEVQKIWEAIGAVADFVPLSSLPEAQKPFSHFKQTKNDRMNRVIHFEIEADDPAKVSGFYRDAFGWEFHQWGQNEYWLADTGREPCPGIDGAVMKRKQPEGGVTNTIHVQSLEEAIRKIERAGGKVCVPKMAIEGVGYLAYCSDPEENVFGIMQPDMAAK